MATDTRFIFQVDCEVEACIHIHHISRCYGQTFNILESGEIVFNSVSSWKPIGIIITNRGSTPFAIRRPDISIHDTGSRLHAFVLKQEVNGVDIHPKLTAALYDLKKTNNPDAGIFGVSKQLGSVIMKLSPNDTAMIRFSIPVESFLKPTDKPSQSMNI